MKKTLFIIGYIIFISSGVFAQGAKNIKINEVLTINTQGIQDEFGEREPWIELVNSSYSSYNVRGMFITTDRKALDNSLSPSDRMKLMSQLPDDDCCKMTARSHLLFFLNSRTTKGVRHLETPVDGSDVVWVALYDGNGVDLIDSVSVPILNPNTAYARKYDGKDIWQIQHPDAVTPAMENYVHLSENKVSQLKRDDPHGFGITILAMAIVFSCLLLLYVVFSIDGSIMKPHLRSKEDKRKTKHRRKFHLKRRHVEKQDNSSEEAINTSSNDNEDDFLIEEYIAVAALALKQMEDDVHDMESGIITIRHSNQHWRNV